VRDGPAVVILACGDARIRADPQRRAWHGWAVARWREGRIGERGPHQHRRGRPTPPFTWPIACGSAIKRHAYEGRRTRRGALPDRGIDAGAL